MPPDFDFQIPAGMRVHLKPVCAWASDPREQLRVDERVRKSVVFLGVETPNGFIPCGTGLIGLAIYEDLANTVIITADHVIDEIPGDEVSIRINRHAGGASTLKISKTAKINFKDRAIDLAVFPMMVDPTIYDIWTIPLQSSSWQKLVSTYGEPGEGDEVCVVGLYTTHYGHTRNMPIVRIGHIAGIPEEKVMTHRGSVHGYLIEVHSIGGLSGSPVFLNAPPVSYRDGKLMLTEKGPSYVPLGILIGYHVTELKIDQINVPTFQEPEDKREYGLDVDKSEERRTGFAVVLPIQLIYEIFESDSIMKIMKEGAEHVRKTSGYRPASVSLPSSEPCPSRQRREPHSPRGFHASCRRGSAKA